MKAELIIQLTDEDTVVSLTTGPRQEIIAAAVIALSENKTLRELILKALSRSLDITNEKIKEVPDGPDK